MVYNRAHIGNFRPVMFDTLFRLLRSTYGEDAVVYARNVTDIEDKIITASQETCEIEEITTKYAKIYDEDAAAVNVLPPTIVPWATDHVEMLDIIETLGAKVTPMRQMRASSSMLRKWKIMGLAKISRKTIKLGRRRSG